MLGEAQDLPGKLRRARRVAQDDRLIPPSV